MEEGLCGIEAACKPASKQDKGNIEKELDSLGKANEFMDETINILETKLSAVLIQVDSPDSEVAGKEENQKSDLAHCIGSEEYRLRQRIKKLEAIIERIDL